MAGRHLGRYEILTQLASGGMASVYAARAQGVAGFERLVAIKMLHPHLAYEQEFISMFLDEARLAARIRHMNVVPTLDISDSPGDGYFLVMEYIEGNHLGALLGRAAKRGERLPQPFVCRVLVDALLGLAAAHRLSDERGKPLKLVHRDVSPHNILVGTDGISRLTDFGVAKANVRMASTRAGQFKGKLSYMAPEQAASSSTDQRSDLFSVGIILWESLTGRRLFKGESNGATLNKLLNDSVPRPSELWPELERFDDVVMKALNRDPDERFRSADDFAESLELAVGSGRLAKTREVADVVRDLDADKLQDERERIRDAIKMLGSTDIGNSIVPMPREGTAMDTQSFPTRAQTGSHVRGTVSGVLDDGTPIVIRRASESDALKWFVMALAIMVFLYAGFLVVQLLRSPTAAEAPEPDRSGTTELGAHPSDATKSPSSQAVSAPERASSPAPAGQGRLDRFEARPSPPSTPSKRENPGNLEPSGEPARAEAAKPAGTNVTGSFRN
ncbi:MAG: protein kinase [Deltaproteobacteria bacterium]|nr:protein kinase [Deltaproteobacteria bacterium]NND30223.1 protein kinase [Myxococcales bacterium]MBT8463383.1 protein kinase [Deltaproteobacteria bacterium]MBT8480677.1 protein kinase [Deltaproteobacteria bacterium]NNK08303.1 protein kinase [Myxococcales bacterium]